MYLTWINYDIIKNWPVSTIAEIKRKATRWNDIICNYISSEKVVWHEYKRIRAFFSFLPAENSKALGLKKAFLSMQIDNKYKSIHWSWTSFKKKELDIFVIIMHCVPVEIIWSILHISRAFEAKLWRRYNNLRRRKVSFFECEVSWYTLLIRDSLHVYYKAHKR